MSTPTYTGPSDPTLFKMGKPELKKLAAGRSKRAALAAAELERRKGNLEFKQAKRAAKAAASA